MDIEPEWVQTAQNEDGFTINNYFVNAETGEVTDYEETIEAEIEDFDRALPEGGEE